MPSITVRRFCIAALYAILTNLTSGFSHNICTLLAVEPDLAPIDDGIETNSLEKELKLGMAYLTGDGVVQDKKQAAYWYEKAAKAGDPVAELQMGYLYQSGQGVPLDAGQAVHWYQLAAAGGLTNAKVNLGVAYMCGLGVKKNQELAEKFFEEAATKGNGVAAYYLGNMYYFGTGVSQDKSVARRWFESGVKLHDPQASFSLATFFYSEESGIHKRAELLREAAKAGYVPAMLSLGHLLVDNPDLSKSPQEAVTELERSADAGSWRSSVILGIVTRDGKGRPPDPQAAYYHFKVAGLQGGEQADRLVANDLRLLAAKLRADTKSSIDSEAETWSQKHRTALQFVYNGGDSRKGLPTYAIVLPSGGTHAVELVPPPM
jgi:TPR repeat protein